MKKYTEIYSIIYLVAVIFLFNSCDKNKNMDTDGDPAIPYDTYVKIKIAGVENPNIARSLLPIFDKKIASTLPISENQSETGVWSDVGYGLDAFTTFDVIEQKNSSHNSLKEKINQNISTSNSNNSINKEEFQAATTPLGSTKKYRILLYDGATLVNPSNNVFTAGEIATLKVDAGKQYTWIAYSLDEATDPPFNSGTNTLTAAEIAGKNILYAKSASAITATYGENLLEIVLKHHKVRYDVIIDPTGVFAGLADNSIIDIGTYTGSPTKTFTTLINSGDLNLITGTYSGATPNNSGISAANMRDTIIGTCTTCKVATFYTIKKDAVADSTLAIQFKSLTINHPDANNPTNYGENLVAVFANTAYTPTENNYYRIKATLFPGVETSDGLIWAPSNLRYEANKQSGPKYSFVGTNYYDPERNLDYFKFNAKTSGPSGTSGSGDPCVEVPGGIWRTPTKAEFASLNGRFDGAVRVSQTALIDLGESYALKFDVTEKSIDNLNDPVVIENGRGLYFIFGGYYPALTSSTWSIRTGNPLGLQLIGISLNAGLAQYWTKTSEASNTGVYTNSVLVALLANISSFTLNSSADNALTVDGIQDGLLIRCVRGSISTQ